MRPPQILLKLVAHWLEWKQRKAHTNAAQTQEKLLQKILKLYRQTEMGQAFGIAAVKSSLQFSQTVPTRTADDYLPWWNRVLAENTPGTVYPGTLKYMAKSSGTTSKSKHVPCPPELLANYRRFSNNGMFHTFLELNNYSLLDGKMLVTAYSGTEVHPDSGLICAYGSGIATLESSKLAQQIIRPTAPIMAMSDWAEKIRRTVAEAYPLDIRVMTGIPIAVVDILEQLLDYAKAQGHTATTAKEIWPNLAVYMYSGTPLGLYENKIRRMLGDGVVFFEAYSATECPMAYQYKFGQPGLLLDMTTGYYEFEPVDSETEQPTPRRLRVHEVEIGKQYNMVVTSIGGLFAYSLGDRIEFLSKAPYVIRFSGRVKDELSLCSEQFQLDWVQPIVESVCEQCDVNILYFLVCPQPMASDSSQVGHHWCIEFTNEPADLQQFMTCLDTALRAESKIYDLFRTAERLTFPTVYKLRPGCSDSYAREHLVLGIGKLPQIFNDRTVAEKLMAYDHDFI